jgi:hypothetical protein
LEKPGNWGQLIFALGYTLDEVFNLEERMGDKMKTILMTMIGLLMATGAFAVVDPDPNSIGLYFDENADVMCLDGVVPFELVTMYIILTRPTEDVIWGFELGYDLVGEAVCISNQIHGPAGTCPDTPADNIIIGFTGPMPTSEATILATQDYLYMDTQLGPVTFTLHGSTPSSVDPNYPTVLLADSVFLVTGLSTSGGPSAQINGNCGVVSADRTTFDALKSLYRRVP